MYRRTGLRGSAIWEVMNNKTEFRVHGAANLGFGKEIERKWIEKKEQSEGAGNGERHTKSEGCVAAGAHALSRTHLVFSGEAKKKKKWKK